VALARALQHAASAADRMRVAQWAQAVHARRLQKETWHGVVCAVRRRGRPIYSVRARHLSNTSFVLACSWANLPTVTNANRPFTPGPDAEVSAELDAHMKSEAGRVAIYS